MNSWGSWGNSPIQRRSDFRWAGTKAKRLDKGDEEDRIRKPKKWNQVRLLVVGPKITNQFHALWLNGERIVEYLDPEPRPDLVQGMNQMPVPLPFKGQRTYGADGHAGWVKFRKMRIRKIH